MRRVRPLVALAIAGVMLLPGAVSAAPTVSITGVTVSGGTGSVTGTAAFEAITTAQSVVNPEESIFQAGAVGGSAAGDNAGLKLTDATITPIANGLRFTWVLESMPEQVPPEGVRYTWGFKIGQTQYQLQAKRTNFASTTTLDDPMGHIQQAAAGKDFFQLRGACVTDWQGTSVANCYHLAFLNGAFDIPGKKITMDLPYEAKDSIGRVVAPGLKPGAVIEENQTAGMAVAASFQAAVSNTIVSRYINAVAPYHVGPQVVLGVASAGQDPSTITYSAPGVLNGSTFNGTVSGLTATKNTVYAKACNGVECSYTSFKAL